MEEFSMDDNDFTYKWHGGWNRDPTPLILWSKKGPVVQVEQKVRRPPSTDEFVEGKHVVKHIPSGKFYWRRIHDASNRIRLTFDWIEADSDDTWYDKDVAHIWNQKILLSGQFEEFKFQTQEIFDWARVAIDHCALLRVLHCDNICYGIHYDMLKIFGQILPETFGDVLVEILLEFVGMKRWALFAYGFEDFDPEPYIKREKFRFVPANYLYRHF